MHGKYTCHIRTDIGDSHNDINVVVIRPNACSEKDWQIYPIQHECKEVIELHCPGMFPVSIINLDRVLSFINFIKAQEER